MRNTDHLTDEQLREAMRKPLSPSAAARLRKAREDAGWLLALNLREMERQESDVPVKIESDEK